MTAADGAAATSVRSIRQVLSLWLVVPLIVLVPIAAALMYAVTIQPALDSLDHGLSATALALSNLLTVRDGRVVLPLSEQTANALKTDPLDEVSFAAVDPAGVLLAGEADLVRLGGAEGAARWRFSDSRLWVTAFAACPQRPVV